MGTYMAVRVLASEYVQFTKGVVVKMLFIPSVFTAASHSWFNFWRERGVCTQASDPRRQEHPILMKIYDCMN